jgi:hypothetical protein
MKHNRKKASFLLVLATALSLSAIGPAAAQSPNYYIGTVVMLEGWRTGNVAFTLSASGVPCNGQFILNKSDDGSKNLYALLLSAKATDRTVKVYFTGCGPAEGVAGSDYAQLNYLYLN